LFGRFEIEGWGTSQVLSSDTDTRVVGASVYYVAGTNYSYTTDTPLTFDGKRYDTHGTFNTSTYRYTVPVPGKYQCSLNYAKRSSGSGNDAYLAKNGSSVESIFNLDTLAKGGFVIVECVAGDVLDFRMNLTATVVAVSATFTRISGPSQIAASEKIIAKYGVSANRSTDSSTPINMDTRIIDTHGAVTTGASWKFTAPRAGPYRVSAALEMTTSTGLLSVYKNGVDNSFMGQFGAAVGGGGTTIVQLIAGDYIDFRVNTGSTKTVVGTAGYNVCIESI